VPSAFFNDRDPCRPDLNQNAVGALPGDDWLLGSELVDAAADDLDRLFDGMLRCKSRVAWLYFAVMTGPFTLISSPFAACSIRPRAVSTCAESRISTATAPPFAARLV
jgi:hypothetical protein